MTPSPRAWLRVATWGALALAIRGLLAGAAQDDFAAIQRVVGFLLAVATPALLATWAPRQLAGPAWLSAVAVVATDQLAGPAAWAAALPWALVCGAALTAAFRELLRRRCVPSAIRVVAQVFLLVGAGWLIASRAGVELPGLDPGKILLACAHATATGFAALTLLAVSAERVPRARLLLAGLGATVGVGFGITGIGIAAAPALEPIGGGVLAFALGLYAGFLLLWLLPASRGWAARLALGVAGLALLGALALGVTYSLRHLTDQPLARATLVLGHGWVIGVGFALCGALGHLLARRRTPSRELPVLLFDGECGMCTRSVQTILDLERRPSVRFAPLQGTTAQALLRRIPVAPPEGPFDSLILVHDLDGPRERVQQRWEAVCGVGRRMGRAWACLTRLGELFVPPNLANLGYDVVARNRLRFGGPEQCKIPTPAQRARFLE